jgi:hypothetical protein
VQIQKISKEGLQGIHLLYFLANTSTGCKLIRTTCYKKTAHNKTETINKKLLNDQKQSMC